MVLEGKADTPSGRYDIYVMLADDYHWTPEQIDAMDPAYILELMAYKSAKIDYAAIEADRDQKARDARRKAHISRRKAMIMKRKELRGKR